MASILNRIIDRNLLEHSQIPLWIRSNLIVEALTGSISYGCNLPDSSDNDVFGVVMPKKEMLFPHTAGIISGWDNPNNFENWQNHHIEDPEARKTYDVCYYGLVKYFRLATDNNPNILDTLFIPRDCITFSTSIYEHIRRNRKLFIHKGCFYKTRGYAYSQISRIKNKDVTASRKKYATDENCDSKFQYHAVRLVLECEQLLMYGEMDLRRDKEIYKSIRKGDWTKQQTLDWFENKEKYLEQLFHESKLPDRPSESKLKKLLIECIEMHYGSVDTLLKIERESIIGDLKDKILDINRLLGII
jgi:predicted nucleotidyltransferase